MILDAARGGGGRDDDQAAVDVRSGDSLRDVRLSGWAWTFEALSLLLVAFWAKRAVAGAKAGSPTS